MSGNDKLFRSKAEALEDFDHDLEKEVRLFTERFARKMSEMLIEERKKHTRGKAIMLGMLFSQMTVIMWLFDDMEKVGMEPAEMFESFPDIFVNYLKAIESVKHLWGKVPHQEFREAFQQSYMNAGHYVLDGE